MESNIKIGTKFRVRSPARSPFLYAPSMSLLVQVQSRPSYFEPALPPPLCVGRWGRRRSGVRRGRQRRRQRPPRRRAGPREGPRGRRGRRVAGGLVGGLAVEGGGHEGGAAEGRGEGEAEDQQGEGHLEKEEALPAVSDMMADIWPGACVPASRFIVLLRLLQNEDTAIQGHMLFESN